MTNKYAFLCLILGLSLPACGDDDSTVPDAAVDGATEDTTPDATVGGGDKTITLNLENLQNLGDDYVYEGWVADTSADPVTPISTGTFTLDDDGNLTPSTFTIAEDVLTTGTPAFIITIEPAVGDVPAPADTHVLAGNIADNAATLTIEHPAAMGADFVAGTSGKFFLQTPTSMANADDWTNGIWFIEPVDGSPSAGLTLPTLPAGWVYEGWVVDITDPSAPAVTTTGRFTDPSMADDDAGGPTAGPDAAPPFPGQDFVDPPIDISVNHMAVISVEPEPDYSAGPYPLKPLAAMIDAAAGAMGVQDLAPGTAPLNAIPSGSITIE